MQEKFQIELLYSPKCLGEAEFDCKYHELVYLILNLALFILKTKILDKDPWDCFSPSILI